MNFEKFKELIAQSKEMELESEIGDSTDKTFDLWLERDGFYVILVLRVKEKGVIADIEISYDEDVLVETVKAFSKNDSNIEATIFDWLEQQTLYALTEDY
jgi:hypothetical protein